MAAYWLSCFAAMLLLLLCTSLHTTDATPANTNTPIIVPSKSPTMSPSRSPTLRPSQLSCSTVLFAESSTSDMMANCSICVRYSCYYCYKSTMAVGSFCSSSSTCTGGVAYDYTTNLCPVETVYIPSKYDALIEQVRYYCMIVVPSVVCFCLIACRCGQNYIQERELEKMRERYQKSLAEQSSRDDHVVNESRKERNIAMKKLSFVRGLELPRRSTIETDTENPIVTGHGDKMNDAPSSAGSSSRNFPSSVERAPSPSSMLSSSPGMEYFGSVREPVALSPVAAQMLSQPSTRLGTLLNQPSMMRSKAVADRCDVTRENDEQISL